MDELIDIVTKDGKPTGKSVLKSDIHRKGYFHNTAHIWFYTAEGFILLQQRAATKTICPLLWDVSVSGHVDAGETIEQAAIRETREEIGICIVEEQLSKIGVFKCFQTYPNGIIDNEFHHTFIVKTNAKISEFIPQKNEVEALKYISIKEFFNILDHIGENNHFVASNKLYYKSVIDAILKALT